MITLLLLVRATYCICMVLFFTHIPFVVNHTINATPPERLQQYYSSMPVVKATLVNLSLQLLNRASLGVFVFSCGAKLANPSLVHHLPNFFGHNLSFAAFKFRPTVPRYCVFIYTYIYILTYIATLCHRCKYLL